MVMQLHQRLEEARAAQNLSVENLADQLEIISAEELSGYLSEGTGAVSEVIIEGLCEILGVAKNPEDPNEVLYDRLRKATYEEMLSRAPQYDPVEAEQIAAIAAAAVVAVRRSGLSSQQVEIFQRFYLDELSSLPRRS